MWIIVLKYATLPLASIVYLLANEHYEALGTGGLCHEGQACWVWFPALLFLASFISFCFLIFKGSKFLFGISTSKAVAILISLLLILYIFLL